jgi:hypothetical protein
LLAGRQAGPKKGVTPLPAPQKKIVIERKCIRALEAQLKRWKKTPPKKYNSREEKKKKKMMMMNGFHLFCTLLKHHQQSKAKTASFCYYTLRDLSLSLFQDLGFQNKKRNSS